MFRSACPPRKNYSSKFDNIFSRPKICRCKLDQPLRGNRTLLIYLFISFCTQVLLSLERGVWAPNLHFNNPNTDIPALTDGRIQVIDRPVPTRGGIVGVNSFGFGGSNVHVILRPAQRPAHTSATPRTVPRVLQACGRTEAAVSVMLNKGKEHATDDNFLSLLNDVSGVPPAGMPYRGYTLIGSQSEFTEVQQVQATARPLWYICSGKPSAS